MLLFLHSRLQHPLFQIPLSVRFLVLRDVTFRDKSCSGDSCLSFVLPVHIQVTSSFFLPKPYEDTWAQIVFLFCFEVSFLTESPENGNRIPSYYRYSTRSFAWGEFYSVHNFSITIVQKLFTCPFCISFTYFMRIIICCNWERLIFWTSAASWIDNITPPRPPSPTQDC
jgi:hypothetical protein